MSVSVSMPQLGESVTEGTVTRWLKREGERVEADEPLLEVSTDKVDTEIPSPVSGIVRGITVAEDETVAVGAELAVIDEDGAVPSGGGGPSYPQDTQQQAPAQQAEAQQFETQQAPAQPSEPQQAPAQQFETQQFEPQQAPAQQFEAPRAEAQPEPQYETQQFEVPQFEAPQAQAPAPQAQAPQAQAPQYDAPPSAGYWQQEQAPAARTPEPPAPPQEPESAQAGENGWQAAGAESPYVTPLVRKLAAEHGVDLSAVPGTGVGGRIRKQDVLEAARALRGNAPVQQTPVQQTAAQQAPVSQTPVPQTPVSQAPAQQPPAPAAPPAPVPQAAPPVQAAPAAPAPSAAPRQAVAPSSLRGRTEKLSRSRQVIAQRMMESLQSSAQLTTVVEADITEIARLRDRARNTFEAREGVRLSFLPFFALAAVESLKEHPSLNAFVDTDSGTVTYHDAEHLGIAVDTERGLMVPVIRKAGDLNIGGLARKIADLAARTRAGRVSPDELSGGTFTLTNTGSRGALFDTPIINQPQVGILGTGTVVKRPVVMEDAELGEVIVVRSMVYLALTYDHQLVDGADAARFLGTVKARLEEGAFESELGL
jgi:pyruvate dehydrogenase E2 component (dihydrolipoamide acetyltransferase)